MVHHLGREAMKRRAAAFRAAAPFTSLRLRHEHRGEALAVGALVAGVAAGFDDSVDVRRQSVAVRWESRAFRSPLYAASNIGGVSSSPSESISPAEGAQLRAAGDSQRAQISDLLTKLIHSVSALTRS